MSLETRPPTDNRLLAALPREDYERAYFESGVRPPGVVTGRATVFSIAVDS